VPLGADVDFVEFMSIAVEFALAYITSSPSSACTYALVALAVTMLAVVIAVAVVAVADVDSAEDCFCAAEL